MTEKPQELWDYKRIAEETGLSVGTLRRYKKTGHMPAPDELPAPDRPRWYPTTITEWMASRPGRGTRTDLRGEQ
ncbi:helix-turn-helix transcriptional regulator [Streptomyces sp. AC1-42T]|uniref:helix-turn-helix transcriptional regulator n=1 Tax=Streptomyces sp. AC1-42T TaxID=2218665 RepID=UPI000DACBD85|nr:MarR family transcriptional regulator [Streptomyces sp. AC1-42T]PZT71518.1 MarR family transcriptional regulator [Streptomyces sp. AC1-42T]